MGAQPQGRVSKKAKADSGRLAQETDVERLDMVEGPESFSRFRSVMKAILSGRGASRDPDAQTPS